MERKILKEILINQSKKLQEKNIVERETFKDIKKFVNTPFIMIISGIRRSGKSTLLNQFRSDDTHYVNFDDERFINFQLEDFQNIYEILIELFGEKDKFLFDEIQNIFGWERFVRRLHDEKKKIYITGSNATMLSKELGTHLTGRHIKFSLYPFSFKEFLMFRNFKIDLKMMTANEKSLLIKEFNKYFKQGGFPEYLKYEKEDYLKAIYENIIYRDIITRYKLSSEKPLKEVVYYVASNIGKELSFNTLKNLTGLSSTTTIREYFEYLENSYLIFLVPRFDYSLKKQIYSPKKAYIVDNALARILGFRVTQDIGRLFENLVFLELKRMNKEIYYFKERGECDFVTRDKGKIKQAIQVCYELNEKNKKREIDGLVEAMEKFKLKKGLILTHNQEDEFNIKGNKIIVMPVWKWILK